MKIFKFIAQDPDWDELSGFIIFADDEKEAWDFFDDEFDYEYSHESDHKNWVVTEVDMLKKGIILSRILPG